MEMLQESANEATYDWRDELVWAGFAESFTAHNEWARQKLGQE